MHYSRRLVIAIVFITIIAWLDYHYFMEPNTFVKLNDNVRRAYHLLSLSGIAIIGCIAWGRVSKVIFKLWVGSYAIILSLLVVIGILNQHVHLSIDFLVEVSRLRIFFCGPMPFAALYVFYRLFSKKNAGPSS
jgi:hypothetical protein